MGVGDHIVRIRLKIDVAVGVLQRVHARVCAHRRVYCRIGSQLSACESQSLVQPAAHVNNLPRFSQDERRAVHVFEHGMKQPLEQGA